MALQKLHASRFLREVWSPDEDSLDLRCLVAKRVQIVSHVTRLKTRAYSILHVNLIPLYAGGGLFSKKGRKWLNTQPLPEDQNRSIVRHLDGLDRVGVELALFDKTLPQRALAEGRAARLMTVGGATIAISLLAAIGDITRFCSSEKLVSYSGRTRACYSRAFGQPTMAGSPSGDGRMLAPCW